MPGDYEEKILGFLKFVKNTEKETFFEPEQIGNMDKVPLRFNVLSNNTVNVKGSKIIGHKKITYIFLEIRESNSLLLLTTIPFCIIGKQICFSIKVDILKFGLCKKCVKVILGIIRSRNTC